jgi:hypothetical protein
MRGRRIGLALCVVALAATAVMVSVAAGQPGSPTLETEDLFAQPDGVTTTFSCNTEGTSTVSWTAEGIASGPFPGTFTLSGTLTIGPQSLPGAHPPGPNTEGTVAGPVQTFQESFTIESGTTTITGTKTLDPQATSGTAGTCQTVSQFPILDFFDGHGTVVEVNAQTRYQASIQGPDGTTSDSGIAYVALADIQITGSCPTGSECQGRLAGFNQTFALSDGLISFPGSSNGGGQVPLVTGSGKVAFAFHARRNLAGMQGACNVVDRLARRHIRCLTVESYTQVGNHVSIAGRGDDNGIDTGYRIEADDNGEPNQGADSFTIETDSGFVAGGNVTNGDVQVR